jgi:hypothetical protein
MVVARTAMADPNQLSRQERYLVYQIHPAKLATNVSVSVGSTVLFWQPRLVPGLLVFTVPSPVASALVLAWDLSGYRDSAVGRYVLATCPCPCKPSGRSARSPSPYGVRRRPAARRAGPGCGSAASTKQNEEGR